MKYGKGKKVNKLCDLVEFVSGSPQVRIIESLDKAAPVYKYYSQIDLTDDLVIMSTKNKTNKKVQTFDRVNTLSKGDIVFSLISGMATIVSREHGGYVYTQNYIKIIPKEKINSKYLVYLLNENEIINKQFSTGLQGSMVIKYTLKQLREINIPKLPSIEEQEIIGQVYLNQLRVQALKERVAQLETKRINIKLKEFDKSE